MTRQQASRYGRELLGLTDEEGHKRFDALALFSKPIRHGEKRYSLAVRDIGSGQTIRFWTTREVSRFLKTQKRKGRNHFPLLHFIHRA
jgi:hypothetical protein